MASTVGNSHTQTIIVGRFVEYLTLKINIFNLLAVHIRKEGIPKRQHECQNVRRAAMLKEHKVVVEVCSVAYQQIWM